MDHPSTDTIISIIQSAARAPSGDNVQPWNFRWDGACLAVGFRPDLARHVLDTGLSASTIALGCLLESIRIAASAHALAAQFTSVVLPLRDGVCAEVRFVAGAAPPDPLFSALLQRTTDRRPYRRGPVPADDLMAIWREFDDRQTARVDCTGSLSADLLRFIASAESLVGAHSSIFTDTLAWIRLTRKEVARTQDGMPWRGTGVGIAEYPALRLMRSFPRTFQLFRRAGMRSIQASRVRKLLQSSAGLVSISVVEESSRALVSAGRLSMRLWLRLSQLGYGVQPLTISSLLMYNAKRGMLDPETARLFGPSYPEGEHLFRDAFAIPEQAQPVWLWRIGLSTPLPSSWLTPRRKVEDILHIAPNHAPLP